MMKTLRRSLLGALLVIAVMAIGRVALSFAFVAGSVSQTLTVNGDPTSLGRLITQAAGGFTTLGGILSPGARRPMSVLDVPAELEARRKDGDIAKARGGALILTVPD